MHAFITQISNFKFQISNSPDTLVIEPDTSIGIEEVRQIQHFLSRKPIQSDHNTVIIHQAHLLTIPAQNALLKTLEEPPGNSQIYLVTDWPDQLLPTVLSRVQIISAPHKSYKSDTTYMSSQASSLLHQLLAAGVGERLKLMENQAFTRTTALEFLDHLEFCLHQTVNNSPGALYSLVCSTRKYLKANCNLKLCLDYLAINL